MKECNELVRDNVAGLLKNKGYQIKGKIIKGEKYTFELCSLFWQNFKQSVDAKGQQMKAHYAEMLEVFRALMLSNKVSPRQLETNESQPVRWYKNMLPKKQRLANAQTDLLQKFIEFLPMKTEAVKDQLNDMFNSFKQLVEANNIDFAQVEELRRSRFEQLGGFSKGIYLEGVSKTKTHTI